MISKLLLQLGWTNQRGGGPEQGRPNTIYLSCLHKKVFIPIRQQLIYKSIWGGMYHHL